MAEKAVNTVHVTVMAAIVATAKNVVKRLQPSSLLTKCPRQHPLQNQHLQRQWLPLYQLQQCMPHRHPNRHRHPQLARAACPRYKATRCLPIPCCKLPKLRAFSG